MLRSLLMTRTRLNSQRTAWYFTDDLIDQTRDLLSCPTATHLEEQEQRRLALEELAQSRPPEERREK